MPFHAATGEAAVHSAASVAPAAAAEVGGDFQTVCAVGSKTVVLVGDVAGNGVDAGPYADRLCRGLGEMVASADPVAVLEALNDSPVTEQDGTHRRQGNRKAIY